MGNTFGYSPLKISDRAWWLEVQVLKSHGNRKNDKGLQDMEIDCIQNVTTDLSAEACLIIHLNRLFRPRPRSHVFQMPCCD